MFQADVMPSAEQLERWRPQLRIRSLLAGNAEQLPTRELREASIYSCGELADIQLDHASECPEPNQRNVSEAAQEEIRGVVAVLDEALRQRWHGSAGRGTRGARGIGPAIVLRRRCFPAADDTAWAQAT